MMKMTYEKREILLLASFKGSTGGNLDIVSKF